MNEMTSKQRLLCTLNLGEPDRVPIAPDIMMLYPAKYSGKPFWEWYLSPKTSVWPYLNLDPPLWQMTIDLARKFKFDVMAQMYLGDSKKEKEIQSIKILRDNNYRIAEYNYNTSSGLLRKRTRFTKKEGAWIVEPLIKDVEQDYKKILSMFVNPWEKDTSEIDKAKIYIGEDGLIGNSVGVPSFYWFLARDKIQDAIMDYYDYPKIMEKFTQAYREYALEYIKASCVKSKPDYFIFSGSYASMSIISPTFYREHNLPFLKQACELLKEFGVPSCVHMCGKSNEMIEVFAKETELNMIEPLEAPPTGNISLKEVKQKYGKRLCLKGNVNTFKTLEKGTPQEVEEEAKKCIEDGAEGGGFILSSGDEVPFDTPEQNLKAMINAGKKYGVY